MLEQVAHYNDLSPKLRQEMEEKILSFGKKVRYRFAISNKNPDPEKRDGEILWPFMYSLDPITFRIVDPYEDRPGKSKSKQVGLVKSVDKDGKPESFNRIRIYGRHKGELTFDLESPEEQDMVMILELHPKLVGGKFADKGKLQIVSRIDEKQEAREGRARREAKKKALIVAGEMSEDQVKEFAAAMQWDEHESIEMLINRVEEMAETNPEVFNDIVNGKTIEYLATIKRAFDKQIISYNPAEYSVLWFANQQKIAMLGENISGKSEVERFADWCMTGGKKAEEAYKKIHSLVKV